MGQRVYKTFFENVTIAALQDIFSLKAGEANGLEIHQIDLSAGGVTAPAEIRLRIKVAPATVTQGTGGTAPTISPSDSGDTKTATATARANDITTQTTSTGTMKTLQAHQWNVLLPWQYLPAPEDREVIQAGEAFIIDVAAAPASTVVSGSIAWREVP
jgi:hypothetical protein